MNLYTYIYIQTDIYIYSYRSWRAASHPVGAGATGGDAGGDALIARAPSLDLLPSNSLHTIIMYYYYYYYYYYCYIYYYILVNARSATAHFSSKRLNSCA